MNRVGMWTLLAKLQIQSKYKARNNRTAKQQQIARTNCLLVSVDIGASKRRAKRAHGHSTSIGGMRDLLIEGPHLRWLMVGGLCTGFHNVVLLDSNIIVAQITARTAVVNLLSKLVEIVEVHSFCNGRMGCQQTPSMFYVRNLLRLYPVFQGTIFFWGGGGSP